MKAVIVSIIAHNNTDFHNRKGRAIKAHREMLARCIRAHGENAYALYKESASGSLETRCVLSGECSENDDRLSDSVRGIGSDLSFIL